MTLGKLLALSGLWFSHQEKQGDSLCSTLFWEAVVNNNQMGKCLGAIKGSADVGKLFSTLLCFLNNLRNIAIDHVDDKNSYEFPGQMYPWRPS